MKRILLPFLLLIANISICQVNLNLGLRCYYPFSSNAHDISGNMNDPVFNNATLTTDRFGNPNCAYHFNGVDNYMQIPHSASLNIPSNKISISLWVKPTGYNTAPCYGNMLITKSAPTTLPSNFYVLFTDVNTGCTAPTTTQERFTGNNAVALTPFVQLNQWYSIVWTSDGVTEKIYVNCELKGSAPAGGVPFSNAFDMFFGHQNNTSFPYWLNGDLDEIRIYDRVINQGEIDVLGGCAVGTTCTNWLLTPSTPSAVHIGDLDLSGHQFTIEANYTRIAYATEYGVGSIDLVSKQAGPGSGNLQTYYLGTELAGIRTTDGYFSILIQCHSLLYKNYHAALVYNGSTLRYYRDGYLINEINATGDLVQIDGITTIGLNEFTTLPSNLSNFMGNINEVRFWNVARSQSQLQTYMNASLPNPATQPGLLAYYTFDNLLNKQGNPAYNGTLYGSALINQPNLDCNFVPSPGTFAYAGPDTSFCSATLVSHVLQGNGNGSFIWVPAANLNNPNIQNPIATVNATTTFYLTVTGAGSCAPVDSVTIFVNPPPAIKTLADTSICKTDTLVLTTTAGLTTYNWSPGTAVNDSTFAGPLFIGAVSDSLVVTGFSSAGCFAKDTVKITVKPLPTVKTIGDTSLCYDKTLTLTTTGANSYSWSPSLFLSDPDIASPVFSGNQNQSYIVTGISLNGCKANDTINITAGLKPIINISKSNDIDCAFPQATLFASGGVQYKWSPSTGLSNTSIPNPIAKPVTTQQYNVLVTDASGCINSDSIIVFIQHAASLARYMPNAFTPDGNGNNDCYG